MARKTMEVTITAEGRDHGKVFLLQEMSAEEVEDWSIRAMLALIRGGFQIPDETVSQGLAGLKSINFLDALSSCAKGLQYDEIKPLLDKMLTCVMVLPDQARPEVKRRLRPEDIEEVSTRVRLRKEVVALHTDFF